jgi:hypothetical protein
MRAGDERTVVIEAEIAAPFVVIEASPVVAGGLGRLLAMR